MAKNDTFSTLVAAVNATNATELLDALSGEGPFTVFAPTDEAFDALPNGTVEALLQDVEQLTDILLFHVISANLLSSSLSSGDVETLNGDSVEVVVSDEGNITVNDANITMPDIITSNGIVHAIDSVLLPPTEAPTKMPTAKSAKKVSGKAAKSSGEASKPSGKASKSTKPSKAAKKGKKDNRNNTKQLSLSLSHHDETRKGPFH